MRTSINTNNMIQLIGRVSKVNEYGNGVASVSIALDNGKDKDGNKHQTTFIETKSFNKAVYDLISVGQRVQVIGHLASNSYEKDGATIYGTDVVADSIVWLESKAESDARAAKQAEEAPAEA